MRSLLLLLADASASVIAAPVRMLTTVAQPFVRLWRLARMRAQCRGRIPVTLQLDGPIRTEGRPNVQFGRSCRLGRDVFFETVDGAEITVGDRVRINAGTYLVAYAGISIGNDCLIGEYASLRDANHGTHGQEPIREQPHDAKEIAIGENVWIGRGSAVLRGVRIGDGAVIGANSTVTGDVAARTLAVGSPARSIRRTGVPRRAEAGPDPTAAEIQE